LKKNIVFTILLVSLSSKLAAQNDKQPIQLSAYIETYFGYDANKPFNHTKPSFLYSFNKHNQVNINIAYIKANYSNNLVRGNFSMATGTYMNANLANEEGVFKNLFEANVGMKISKKKNIWVDAGVFPSHIGFESAIGKDCWNTTRSILAENSPYFETGIKLTYISKNEKLSITGLLLSGWQRIQRVPGNQTPAFGHQLTYKPTDKITLNSSSFIGNDKPDSARQMRYFHNFYGIFQLTKTVALTTGFDIGAEQKSEGATAMNVWYSPIIIAQYKPTEKNCFAARIEFYNDKNSVITAVNAVYGLRTWGYSINYDYAINSNAVWRIEARNLAAKDAIFTRNNQATTSYFFVTTSLAIGF
jgi:hypothetical protein